ncbi:MAG TPA: hypothetical protein VL625_04715 [Patescibacteria group bacterium]|nr:hypothetical protein [Patescibacteria group bacterium]
MRLMPVIILVFLCCWTSPAGADRGVTSRVINAKLKLFEWLPPGFGQGNKRWPLVVFSHGYHGCGPQSKFLTEGLAKHGYVVVAPNHEDASCGRRLEGSNSETPDTPTLDADAFLAEVNGDKNADHGPRLGRRLRDRLAGKSGARARFGNPASWNQDSFKDRFEDIEWVINYALSDKQLAPFIDTQRIGLAGHSLGGYTVLGLAGGWPSWKDKRVKAVLALSPYGQPFAKQHTLRGIDVPVMYQGGTRDTGITPFIKGKDGMYDQTPSPKYFVEFARTGHFGFTNMTGPHDRINDYAFAFFDKYLLGQDSELLKTGAEPGVTDWRAAP